MSCKLRYNNLTVESRYMWHNEYALFAKLTLTKKRLQTICAAIVNYALYCTPGMLCTKWSIRSFDEIEMQKLEMHFEFCERFSDGFHVSRNLA